MSRRELPPRNDPSHRESPFEVPVHRLDFRLGNEAPRGGALHHRSAVFTTGIADEGSALQWIVEVS